MQLYRVVLSWHGSPVVGNAVTVLHFDGSNQSAPPVAAILSAFQTNAQIFTNQTSVTVPVSGDTIEDTTGALVGTWSATGGGTMTGSNTGIVAAGVGACITWKTGGIVTGKKGPRRLRGRTFIVPLAAACYDSDGTIASGALANLVQLADGIMGAGPLAVWHRPTTVGGTNGTSYGVLSNNVRDKVAVLTSRRD